MSSHREAPEISKDPVADSTDLYAFVSPDRPDTVTIIANYVPLEAPDGGPNFYEFGDDVRYAINIANRGTAEPDISYLFDFTTVVEDPDTFLYNTGQITSLTDSTFNRRQYVTVSRSVGGAPAAVLGRMLACPPCNIGPRSTPNYSALATAAIHSLPGGITFFAGQRAEGFFVDLGAVFDLLDLRPFQNLHVIPTPAKPGVNALSHVNVHTIALQVPASALTADGHRPTDPADPASVVGIWTTASRHRSTVLDSSTGRPDEMGTFVQVSRLGNPLINEAIIPMGRKDYWNAQPPVGDKEFAQYYLHPEVSKLLPVLYPGVFPRLAGLSAPRTDLAAILLTGIPPGVVTGFQNYTGATEADLLRLNMAVPPSRRPNPLGLIGGDPAGFPNGRRPSDDVVTIELRALAGLTYPLVHPSYRPDAAASAVTDGAPAPAFLARFPYLNTPHDGFDSPS